MPAKVPYERIDPDTFDGLCMAMQDVELAAPLSIPKVLPVGCLVAGTGEARLLDEGFEQNRAVAVAGVPVVGESAADQGQDP